MKNLYKDKFRIESARLRDWDYSTQGWYYITICTKDKKCWLGNVADDKLILNPIGLIVENEWKRTAEIRSLVTLDYYVIMPNHLHGIIEIQNNVETHCNASLQPKNNLSNIVKGFKSITTAQIRKEIDKTFSWQPGFYDHIIRNEEDLQRIREYIQSNPVKWIIEKKDKNNFINSK